MLEGDTFRPCRGPRCSARSSIPSSCGTTSAACWSARASNGLFLYDGATLAPFPTEIDALLQTWRLYRGIVLPDGTIALATTLGGMMIIDRDGRLLTRLDLNHGLPSNAVYYLMVDREGALWLAIESGMARVETPSPASFFDKSRRVPGLLLDRRGTWGASSWQGDGVAYLRPANPGARAFRPRLGRQQPVLVVRDDARGMRPEARRC